ncbi:unnamed protein product [Cunninghamella blakesleeana]
MDDNIEQLEDIDNNDLTITDIDNEYRYEKNIIHVLLSTDKHNINNNNKKKKNTIPKVGEKLKSGLELSSFE